MANNDTEYAQTIANMLIEQLERGTAPWQKPWSGGEKFMPNNPISGKSYKGSNALYLMAVQESKGYQDNRWLTYKQADSVGGQVRKGEKSTKVRFWQWTKEQEKTDAAGKPILGADGKPETETVRLQRPWVRQFAVFNADQIDGLPPREARPQISKVETVERAEKILSNSGANIVHKGGDRAFYSLGTDQITLPEKEQFKDTYNYYSTALHELGHWTGHPSRLDRELGNSFGSEKYAKEELRAEIASLMLADEIGVENDPEHVEQHAAYVGSWIKALKEDPTEILRAASDAQKITRYVMGLEQQQEQEIQQEQSEQQGHYSDQTVAALIERHGWQQTSQDEPSVEKIFEGVGPLVAGYAADPERRRYIGLNLVAGEPSQLGAVIVDFDGREASPEKIAEQIDLAAATYADEQRVKRGYEARYVEEAKSAMEENTNSAAALPSISDERTILNTKFSDRAAVKELGAKWDKEIKKWTVPAGQDLTPFSAWLPSETEDQQTQPTSKVEAEPAKESDQLTALRGKLAEAQKAVDDWPKTEAEMKEKEDRDRQELDAAHDAGIVSDEMYVQQSSLLNGADFRENILKGLIDERDEAQEAVEKAQGVKSPEVLPVLATEKTYLSVQFPQKEEAKSLGAKWDKDAKSWYAPAGSDLNKFEKFTPKPVAATVNLAETAQDQFGQALKDAGLIVDGAPVMDGKIHRVQATGDKGRERSGAYCGFLDGRPGGWFQNYKTGEKQNWKADAEIKLTPEERASMLALAAQQKADREKERQATQDKAAGIAQALLGTAAPAQPDNAYLIRKGVTADGMLQATEATVAKADEAFGQKGHSIVAGDLLVPMRDATEIRSVQVIKPDGWKGFMPNGQVTGTYEVFGEATNGQDKPVWIAEGLATAKSIHEATGEPVVVAFNASNLLPVAEEVRKAFPDAEIFIAGDDDRHLPLKTPPQPNVGVEKAEEAAAAVNGLAILPTFGAELDGVDWNDIAQKEGLGGLARELNETITEVQEREARERKEEGRKQESGAEQSEEREDTLSEAVSAFRNIKAAIGEQQEAAQAAQSHNTSQTVPHQQTATRAPEKTLTRPGIRIGGRRG